MRRVRRRAVAGIVCFGAAGLVAAASTEAPRTILDLQPFREERSIAIRSPQGRDGTATLINLNPGINAWHVLKITSTGGAPARVYHLENPRPRTQQLFLDQEHAALVIADDAGRYRCDLFGGQAAGGLDAVNNGGAIFQPVCGARLYRRNPAVGRHTRLEAATDFLREHVWGGEGILSLGHRVLGDRNRETGTMGPTPRPSAAGPPRPRAPLAALVEPRFATQTIASENLGIAVAKEGAGLVPGVWYPAAGTPDVYVSLLQPRMISTGILHGGEKTVNALDGVESSALVYLIAFDLDRFDLAYAGGTENPSVEWSAHMLPTLKDPRWPGPDGIGAIAPLVATGLVNPIDGARTIAAFTGGFKRAHGAFLYGDLATKNYGSHYGVIENGTVFSTLQPGLATIVVAADGAVAMKTWTTADNAGLCHVRHARQNGVPIVEVDERSQAIVPGRLVNRWGPGNWSGSEDLKLRTIRGAAGIQKHGEQQFLIYAVFSSATPSAMARVFQAYQCRYAMPLDMNALEHTYLALHQRTASGVTLQHLIKGMSQLDRASKGTIVPRFVGYPDNRDFFYLMRRVTSGQ